MVTLTDISKRYGGRVLFQDVNLQLHEGAQYGIVGANGAGKSTLLRILSGEESSSTGNVQMPRRARIGVLEQNHFQYDSTRILDVVMMGRTKRGMRCRPKRPCSTRPTGEKTLMPTDSQARRHCAPPGWLRA